MRRKRRRRAGSGRVLRPELLWRILLYGLLILILASAECSFFGAIRDLPATPDLMLGAVVAVALLDHRRASTVFAMAGGFCLEAIGGAGIPLAPLYYFAIALVVGALGEKMLPKYGSFLVLLLPAILMREAFGLLELWLSGAGSVGAILLGVILPDAYVTAVFVLPLYFLVKLCMLPFRERRR